MYQGAVEARQIFDIGGIELKEPFAKFIETELNALGDEVENY